MYFPNKQALLTAMVRERFQGMSGLAHAVEKIGNPREAFETMLRSYLEAAEGDVSFQLSLRGQATSNGKGLIERAVASGEVRGDLTWDDFPVLANGIIATMYFKPSNNSDWRRHLELVPNGICI